VKSRLPRKPQPVPPIFQPEVAADAIFWAAYQNRPEIYLGWPTVKAIVGDKIAPRFADWYLARNGYDAQQTEEPVEEGRPDNLWTPIAGDHGAHGSFDARAHSSSWQFWLSKHRRLLTYAGLAAAGALALAANGTASQMRIGRRSTLFRHRRLGGAG
jgi:hypothetical protein